MYVVRIKGLTAAVPASEELEPSQIRVCKADSAETQTVGMEYTVNKQVPEDKVFIKAGAWEACGKRCIYIVYLLFPSVGSHCHHVECAQSLDWFL